MSVKCSAKQFGFYAIAVLLLVGGPAARAFAQGDHDHGSAPQPQVLTADQKAKAGALINAVREATERYKDSTDAEGQHYGLQFGCVSGSDYGAMGLHFVNFPLVFDGEIDVNNPEIILYEALAKRQVAHHRRGLSGAGRSMAREASGTAAADGSVVSLFRKSESFRLAAVLHLARVGMERKSKRRVHELESQRIVRSVRRSGPLNRHEN